MSEPTRGEMVQAAITLLRRGLLPSALPARLMRDYGLSREAAAELAGVAIRRWRAQKPPRSESNGGKQQGRGE